RMVFGHIALFETGLGLQLDRCEGKSSVLICLGRVDSPLVTFPGMLRLDHRAQEARAMSARNNRGNGVRSVRRQGAVVRVPGKRDSARSRARNPGFNQET